MHKTYLETDRKIDSLPPESIGRHPVSKGSAVFLINEPTSKRFVWITQYPRKSGKYVDVRLDEWKHNVNEILALVKKAKKWHETNPNKHPRVFFQKKVIEEKKVSLKDAYEKYWSYYKKKNKPKTWEDRKNKWKIILDFFGEDIPLSEFEGIEGRKRICELLEKKFFAREVYSQGKRTRQVLKGLFDYATHPDQNWMKTNPALVPHLDEELHEKLKAENKKEPNQNKHIEWKEIPNFLKIFSSYSDEKDFRLSSFFTKAVILMPFRVGAISALEWSWYDTKKDLWIIPSNTEGLKNKKGDITSDGLIPSTPEINLLMNKIQLITGNKKHIFWSSERKKHPYISSGIANSILMKVSLDKQTGHGWRKVFVEGTQTGKFSPHIIERCIGHQGHQGGAWGHYDKGLFLEERRECMEWWTKELKNKGLKI